MQMECRFTQPEILRLAHALEMPAEIYGSNGIKTDAVTALCMLLRRLSYPNRHANCYLMFGWRPERMSRIVDSTLTFIYSRWRFLLEWNLQLLSPIRLRQYADIIHRKGCPLENCWGFIDGSLFPIARPGRLQRCVYNGHKRKHCLKYHCIVVPDGLIAHAYGPWEGRRNDAHLWNESRLDQILEAHGQDPNGQRLQLYGDSAYGNTVHCLSPYGGNFVTSEQHRFNQQMSRLRIVNEWVFKELKTVMFPFLNYGKNLKLYLQPVGKMITTAMILHNAHVCLHHPQITQFFRTSLVPAQHPGQSEDEIWINPPLLEEYFTGNAPSPNPYNFL